MAKANFTSKVVEPERVIPAVHENLVHLTLTEEEALVLLLSVYATGGDPVQTSRGVLNGPSHDSIYYQLKKALGANDDEAYALYNKFTNRSAVYFTGVVKRG